MEILSIVLKEGNDAGWHESSLLVGVGTFSLIISFPPGCVCQDSWEAIRYEGLFLFDGVSGVIGERKQ